MRALMLVVAMLSLARESSASPMPTATLMGGFFLLTSGLADQAKQRESNARDATIVLAVGATALVTGIPIAVIGGKRMRAAEKRMLSLSMSGLQGQF